MQGTIVQVNTSRGGLPKRAVPGGFISEEDLEGDAHAHPGIHGGLPKAILLIAAEVIDGLTARGYPLFYGALGENLTTRGFPLAPLRIGDTPGGRRSPARDYTASRTLQRASRVR